MKLILFVLATWGLTNIVCYGAIFRRLRMAIENPFDSSPAYVIEPRYPFFGLFRCPMCFGFWAGLLFHGLLSGYVGWLGALVIGPFIASATSYFLCMVVDDFGIRFNRNKQTNTQ